MKKHAYLIIAHHHLQQLKVLLELLDDERNDIYLHVDKKSQMLKGQDLSSCLKKSKLYLLESLSVGWGDYNMIQCELRLLSEAIKGSYAYYHLISGVDLPLKTQDEIHAFFEEHEGTEFIQFNDPKIKKEYIDRIKYYHFFQHLLGRNQGFWNYLERISIKIQKILKVNRLSQSNMEIQKGTNWFSITDQMANYVVSKQDWVKKHCSYSFLCRRDIFADD